MLNPVLTAQTQLKTILDGAFTSAMNKGALPKQEIPEYTIEIPKDTSHGDFASNAAMVSAKSFRQAPRAIAQILIDEIDLTGTSFERMEIAGPGFLNFFLGQAWFASTVAAVRSDPENYGRSDYGKGEKIMVEFVSANPTGPMHMGNARGGAIGDGLAAALEAAGYDVSREFYINDAGNQIEKFAHSLEARYLQLYLGEDQVSFPEDGYQGEDIKERAKEFAAMHQDRYVNADPQERRDALVAYALPKNVAGLKADLEKYRVRFDVWFSEKSLHDDGSIDRVIKLLTEKGCTYEKDGALWYTSSRFGCEKDDVLVRANGIPTYLAADIAYHYNKFAIREFSRVIDVWGADHHGHVARMKGAMDAIGLDGSKLDIVLMQLVRLMKDGQPYKMSKRTGKAITLTDLLEEIPIDAARFLFNMREPNSTLDFDLDLAVEQSSQNPVYYVQYAHARICSIIKNLASEGIQVQAPTMEQLMLLRTEEEKELIRQMAILPNEVIAAAKNYDPARLTHYIIDLSTLFHKFYNSCRVRGNDADLMQARLNLCIGVRDILKNVLTLLKITAPETM